MTQLNIAYVLAPEKREEKPRPLTKEIHLFLSEMYRHLMIICLIDYNKLCMLLFFFFKKQQKKNTAYKPPALTCGTLRCNEQNRCQSVFQSPLGLHFGSIHPACNQRFKQTASGSSGSPPTVHIHRLRPSVRPPVQPSQAIQQGRGLEGAPQTLHIPLLQPPFCLQRRVLDEGLLFFFLIITTRPLSTARDNKTRNFSPRRLT